MKLKQKKNPPTYPTPKGASVHSHKGKMVFKGVRFDTYQWQQKIFNGKTLTFEAITRMPSVVVIPIEGDDAYIVREKQPHWDAVRNGFITGAVEVGESLEEAARRELGEEAGMDCDNLFLVHAEQYVPGVEWFGYTFIATGLRLHGKTQFDGGEDIKIKKVSIDMMLNMIKKKQFVFRPQFLEYWLVQGKEAALKKLLKKPRSLL